MRNYPRTNFQTLLCCLKSRYFLVLGCIILSIAIVFTVFIPKRNKNATAYNLPLEEKAKIWEAALSEEQKSQVNSAMEIKALIAKTDKYLKNSIAMQANGYNLATLTMYFNVQDVNNAPRNVCQNYLNQVSSGEMLNRLGEKMGWDISTGYYAEILSSALVDNNHFWISLYYTDEEILKTAEVKLEEALQDAKAEIQTILADEFTLTKDDAVIAVKANTGISSNQNTWQSRQNSYISQYNSAITAMSTYPAQNNYFWYLSNTKDGIYTEEKYLKTEDTVVKMPISVKLYCLLGLAAGLVLALAVIFFELLFGDILASGFELYTMFNLPVLCDISSGKKMQSSIAYCAKRLSGLCKASEKTSLMLTGSCLKDKKARKALELLKEELSKNGIEIVFAGSLDEETALENLATCKNVVLLEASSKSRFNKIEELLVTLQSAKGEILTAINIV